MNCGDKTSKKSDLQITLSDILSEMMCITIVGSSSESECDATSDSVDVECLSWDNSEDLYRLYSYDEDYNDDENGNHQSFGQSPFTGGDTLD